MRTLMMLCGIAALSQAQTKPEIFSAGYDCPQTPVVSMGQVITLFVRGLSVPDAVAKGAPLPTTLGGVTVRVSTNIPNYPDRLPIFRVRTISYPSPDDQRTLVTVQIPTEPVCVRFDDCLFAPPRITLKVEVNGVAGQEFTMIVSGSSPHIVKTNGGPGCDTILGGSGLVNCPEAGITHADGTPVGTDCLYPGHPVSPGETIVIYAVGLGATDPTVKTGEAAPSPAPTKLPISVPMFLSFLYPPENNFVARPSVWLPVDGPVYPEYAGLVPGYVGLYQINLKVPTQLPSETVYGGFARMRVRMGVGFFTGPSDGTTFGDVCVKVP
jgi:uncharacterized protein (TIGR03437 family)